MTSLSQTMPHASRGGTSLLYAWLMIRQGVASARTRRYLATLDERALCDLGLARDLVDPPHPRDPAGLWLNRIP